MTDLVRTAGRKWYEAGEHLLAFTRLDPETVETECRRCHVRMQAPVLPPSGTPLPWNAIDWKEIIARGCAQIGQTCCVGWHMEDKDCLHAEAAESYEDLLAVHSLKLLQELLIAEHEELGHRIVTIP